jgi:hypothetical protein
MFSYAWSVTVLALDHTPVRVAAPMMLDRTLVRSPYVSPTVTYVEYMYNNRFVFVQFRSPGTDMQYSKPCLGLSTA